MKNISPGQREPRTAVFLAQDSVCSYITRLRNVIFNVAGFNISIYHYKIKFDITSMISWEKFGIRTDYFSENYLTAVKRARIITIVFSAEDSVQCFCSSARDNKYSIRLSH